MTLDQQRQSVLRRYIVFRIKAIEFLDMLALYNVLRGNQMRQSELKAAITQSHVGLAPLLSFLSFRPPSFVADSIKTVLMSWFAVFIDKNGGMDAIDLWCRVFPKHSDKTLAAWNRMEPVWEILRDFRNKAGFHADSPIRFFDARYELRKEWLAVGPALEEFKTLFDFFLKIEASELRDELAPALESLLNEVEVRHAGTKFQREQFSAYLMIADVTSNDSAEK